MPQLQERFYINLSFSSSAECSRKIPCNPTLSKYWRAFTAVLCKLFVASWQSLMAFVSSGVSWQALAACMESLVQIDVIFQQVVSRVMDIADVDPGNISSHEQSQVLHVILDYGVIFLCELL